MSAGYNQLSDVLQIAGCGQLTGTHPALKWKDPVVLYSVEQELKMQRFGILDK